MCVPLFFDRDLDEYALALIRGTPSTGSSSASGATGETERLLGGIRTLEALVQVRAWVFGCLLDGWKGFFFFKID